METSGGDLPKSRLTELQRINSRTMDTIEKQREKDGPFFVEIGFKKMKKGILPNILGEITEDTRALFLRKLASVRYGLPSWLEFVVMTKDGPKGIKPWREREGLHLGDFISRRLTNPVKPDEEEGYIDGDLVLRYDNGNKVIKVIIERKNLPHVDAKTLEEAIAESKKKLALDKEYQKRKELEKREEKESRLKEAREIGRIAKGHKVKKR